MCSASIPPEHQIAKAAQTHPQSVWHKYWKEGQMVRQTSCWKCAVVIESGIDRVYTARSGERRPEFDPHSQSSDLLSLNAENSSYLARDKSETKANENRETYRSSKCISKCCSAPPAYRSNNSQRRGSEKCSAIQVHQWVSKRTHIDNE